MSLSPMSPAGLHDPALQHLVAAVCQAASQRQPLRISGGGTKDFLGGPLSGEVLSTAPLRGISSYEPTELVVTARAGTPLAELEAVLAEQGQCLAFEPPRFAPEGTVGGMVAAGLAGPARVSVGGVRDFVLGATLLNGRAEVLSFGGQVMKNVAGYDVSRLLAGSMGVLGVICEVSLKVLPVAPATRTLRFDMDQPTALRRLNEWAGQPLPINASAWWEGTLVLRLRGARAAVNSAAQKLGGELIPDELAQAFWSGLRDQTDEFFTNAQIALEQGATLWRFSVAASAPKLALHGVQQLVEWGGAQRWAVSDAKPELMHALAAEARGTASVFRGRQHGAEAFAPLSAPLLRIHRQTLQAFDPAGIFNPQRLHPAL
jgi:glycolate oxidase FAD binding subunit